MAGRTSLTVYQGMIGMSGNVFINVKNRSHRITAEVQIPQQGADGVIVAQARRFGGWSLYVKDGKPAYTYNWLGLQRYGKIARVTIELKDMKTAERDEAGLNIVPHGQFELTAVGDLTLLDLLSRALGQPAPRRRADLRFPDGDLEVRRAGQEGTLFE